MEDTYELDRLIGASPASASVLDIIAASGSRTFTKEASAEDVKDFVVEKMEDFNEAVLETEGILKEMAGSKLKEMKETKMEEMVEEVKPRLRRESWGAPVPSCAPHHRAGDDADTDADATCDARRRCSYSCQRWP